MPRAKQSAVVALPDDSTVAFQWLYVDKRLAMQLLSSNTRNRRLRRERVERYARDMCGGGWWVGSVLNIGVDGIFQNGQHRLQAVVESDTAHWFGIIRGLPPRAQDTMDQGMARSFGAQLSIRGVKAANSVAAATRSMWFYCDAGQLDGSNVHRQPSITELSDLLAEHPGLTEAVAQHPHWVGLGGGFVAGFRYLAGIENPEEVADFLGKLKEGGLPSGDPIRALQDRMTAEMMKRDKPRTNVRAALLIKAWNAWVKGAELKILKWAPYGPLAEPTPRIYGCPIVPRLDAEAKNAR